ncbi:MAG: serine hydrolase domain-containing protein [Rhodothermales bacterium]
MVRKLLIVLILCLVPIQIAGAQQPGEVSYHDETLMPEGQIGERIQSIIDTVNADDPERVRRFIEEECTEEFKNFAPMDAHLNAFLGVRRQTGGIDFHSIRTYTPERADQTVVILKDRNFDAWRGITLRFDEANNYLVSSIGFSEARPPTDVDEPALSETDLVQAAVDVIRRVCDRDVFSGTALLAKGDDVLLALACGEASKRFHAPNDIDTKFNLGSMNKMFTTTAIAQLVEKGVLTYDEPISKYVDESWLPKETTDKVTIHHLLSHTSGLGSYFNDTYWNGSREQYRTVEDFKPLVKDEQLEFEPGARFRYSNTGMLLLGVVIESATGQSYFDYIRENIYAPTGMTHSDSYEMDYPVENLAIGYIPDRDSEYGWQNNVFKHVIKGGPAGGGFSTVGDLHRFARALQTGALVSDASLATMWTDQSGAGYGYGFQIQQGPAGTVVGHGGGFPGLNGNLDIFVDQGYIVAVLANYDRAASPVADRIHQLIARTTVEH